MKTLSWSAVVCLIAAVCTADDFYLKDHTGHETGPFRVQQGATVRAGDQEFTVSKVEQVDEAVLETMRRIIIPELSFRNTSITNAIDFLVKAGKENDLDKKGVSITLWSSAIVPPFKNPAWGVSNITFTGRNLTLYEAVRTVAGLSGLKHHVEATGVRLTPADEPQGELLLRAYPIESSFVARLLELQTAGSNLAVTVEQALKSYLTKVGVDWPRGSAVTYDRIDSQLLVANTAENLATLDILIPRDYYSPAPQVQIDMLFIQFDMTNRMHLAPGDVNAKSLLRAWTNGCGRLLASPSVTTRSGAEASIRGVNEVIYPTAFVPPDGCVGQTNAASSNTCEVMIGTDFATREVGAILTVLPEISPDGAAINLTLSPQYVDLPVWKDYGYDLHRGEGKSCHVPNQQPIFYVYGFATQLSMTDGATVLVGGGMPTHDGKGIIYSFLTVRLVGADGEPIRKPAGSSGPAIY
jgi:hypothetical protein